MEGLWTVKFTSSMGGGSGSGVAVFVGKKVLGGDLAYVYLGDVRIEDSMAYVKLHIEHFAGPSTAIFGNLKEFDLEVSGKVGDSEITFTGHLVQNPSMKIKIVARKRASL